jgi:NAD(P)-dependent dehydrogenase (short-subunit alcohol dehydrogenase family)
MRVSISAEQMRAFEMLSHDRNPIHNDPLYARSTQFGRPIVYGICGVLVGLAHWAGGRAFRLSRVQGRFAKPLFALVEYELKISGEGNQVEIEYLEGETVQMSFGFYWGCQDPGDVNTKPDKMASLFRPLAAAKDTDIKSGLAHWQGVDYSYSIRLDGLSQLLPALGLQFAQMPLNQLNALMGSSYLVGMELPGRQALYSRFEFEFEQSLAGERSAGFQFRNVSADWDARYNRLSISGRGQGMRSFSLFAFQRPKCVRHGIEDIQRAVPRSDALKNKVVFISGAARGFGAVLAKMLAMQDAKVFVNYRSMRDEAEAIANEIRPWNTAVFPIAGDVSEPGVCRQIRTEIEKRFGHIDLLISNAFPQIAGRGFLEQSTQEFLSFLEKAMSATISLFHELLPAMSSGGTVALISTCYTQMPQPQFSHYVAAKAGLEGLMRSLALEFPDQQFIIVRPPRMLTDQTNLPFDLSPPVSAVEVGRKFVELLGKARGESNLLELNLD